MGLVNAAGFPAPGKPEPVKKTKKTKQVEKSEPTVEELLEAMPDECCSEDCQECNVEND
jgi:hypothetical protein